MTRERSWDGDGSRFAPMLPLFVLSGVGMTAVLVCGGIQPVTVSGAFVVALAGGLCALPAEFCRCCAIANVNWMPSS